MVRLGHESLELKEYERRSIINSFRTLLSLTGRGGNQESIAQIVRLSGEESVVNQRNGTLFKPNTLA